MAKVRLFLTLEGNDTLDKLNTLAAILRKAGTTTVPTYTIKQAGSSGSETLEVLVIDTDTPRDYTSLPNVRVWKTEPLVTGGCEHGPGCGVDHTRTLKQR